MAQINAKLPPIVGSQASDLGGTPTKLVCDFGSISQSRQDTVKRVRPIGAYNEIYLGTTRANLSYKRIDAAVGPLKKGHYTYNLSVCMLHSGVGPEDPWGLKTSSVSSALRNQILAQVKGKGVNLAQMLGEYRQTADLFSSCCEKLYRLTMAVRKRDPRILIYDYYSPSGRLRKSVSRRTRRNLSKSWLEYIYGVVPLMSDVHESIDALKNRVVDRPPILHLKSQINTRPQKISKVKDSTWISGFPAAWLYTGSRKNRMSAVVELRNLELLQSLGAYGMTNPAALAWELTPFSFVIDWWVNVGEVLGSLDNLLYINSNRSVAVESQTYEQLTYCESFGSAAYAKTVNKQRFPPVALGTIASLQYKPSISLTHIANGIALIGALR